MATREKDYYKILGVSETANQEELKKAYKALVKQYHPDNAPNDANATEKLIDIEEAYTILSEPNKRKQYDLTIKKTSFNKEDILENIFNSGFGFSYHDIQKEIKTSEKKFDEFMLFLNQLETKLLLYNLTIVSTIKKLED